MPEIRASLSIEVHRKLKGEAVAQGVYLKQFVAQILEKHVTDGREGDVARPSGEQPPHARQGAPL